MNKKFLLLISAVIMFTTILCACGKSKEKISKEEDKATEIFAGKELFTSEEMDSEVAGIDKEYDISNGKDVTISTEGFYKITGSANDVTITVDAKNEDVHLILDSLSISNKNAPCINVKKAHKVCVTTTKSENNLEVTEEFATSKNTSYDAVVYSQNDIVFNGLGTLNIKSSQNGITSKDDAKITGGIYNIESTGACIRADNSIRISDGIVNLKSNENGLHAENEYGDALGYIYIKNGTISILSSNYGIKAGSVVEIDKGNIKINSSDGIVGTFVQVNGGDVEISSQNDGISAYKESDSYDSAVEINGGNVAINMSGVESFAIRSSGDITMNSGKVDVVGPASIKYEGKAKLPSNILTINGSKKNKI